MEQSNINIWALDRDPAIRHLLLLLTAQLGPGAFVIDDSAACDRCAVFVHHPQDPALRAYLYTLGQSDGCYGLHLEYPPATGANLLEIQENLGLAALTGLLAVHFDVPVVAPLPGH